MKKILFLILVVLCFYNSYSQDKKHTPIIFVHGMLGSGDTWAQTVQLFREQGYPSEKLVVMDWNSLMFGQLNTSNILDSIIDDVLLKTNSKQVNLVGHSAGGGVCSSYLKDTILAKKVEKYIHLASGKLTTTPLVKTLNLFSTEDLITGGEDINGVENKAIPNKDHYEIATCKESFEVMYQFFNPDLKLSTETSNLSKNISGKALTLGENKAEVNANISIYAMNPETGERTTKNPIYQFTTNKHGSWGPFLAKENVFYEFVVKPENSEKRTVHYYREPFNSENNLVYLRTLPNSGMASMLLSGIPKDKKQAGLAIFSANKAIIHGRDTLIVNDTELSTETLSPAKKTAIAHFLYDDNKDSKTDGTAIPAFQMFPFLNGVDAFLSSKPKDKINIQFNHTAIKLTPIPSDQGVMVVVFN